MSSLRKLQIQIQNFVFNDQQDFFACVNSQQLQIYRNNIFLTQIGVLRKLYSVIEKLVGQDFFHATAREYIKQYPSTVKSLHDYGDKFAEFLAGFLHAQTMPYLPEVAQLEWGCHEILYEHNDEPFDLLRLKNIAHADHGDIRFKLNSASRLFAFRYSILQIWQICREDNDEKIIELHQGGEKVLVIKKQEDIIFEKLTDGEYEFLSAISKQQKFTDVCKAALNTEPAIDIKRCLQQHLMSGTITDYCF